jgi:hypothetical protein
MLAYRIYRAGQLRTVGFFAIAQVHVAIGRFYMRFTKYVVLL